MNGCSGRGARGLIGAAELARLADECRDDTAHQGQGVVRSDPVRPSALRSRHSLPRQRRRRGSATDLATAGNGALLRKSRSDLVRYEDRQRCRRADRHTVREADRYPDPGSQRYVTHHDRHHRRFQGDRVDQQLPAVDPATFCRQRLWCRQTSDRFRSGSAGE